MATVELRQVRKRFGTVEAIKGIDLSIKDREFVAVVGPSGCGKSTLLRTIAGLEDLTAGDILIDDVRVNDIPADSRGLAMVFQSYALYPHMTAAENMGFALRLARVPKAQRLAKVKAAASILRIEDLLHRKPRELSGGQRQRVAVGRAIVREPKVFLFDEPLSNLDAALRGQMRIELANLHQQLRTTMIYVTHDQVEAMTLAERIVVLNEGRIEQVGTPLDLYFSPRNLFVASFIGSPRINLLSVTVQETSAEGVSVALPGNGTLTIPVDPASLRSGDRATVGLRPESLTLGGEGALAGTVAVAEHLGAETMVYVDIGLKALVAVHSAGDQLFRVGDQVRLAIAKKNRVNLFDEAGMALTAL